LERSRQWAMRCMHEASMHRENCFVTLTYNDQNLPVNGSLNYSDFQKFMKRLRKICGKVRFYMCGEYGDDHGRPHFHACLFGYRFDDLVRWKRSSSGCLVYRSRRLESLWPFGFSSVGDVNFDSAAYVARYCMKKITGYGSDEAYRRVCESTGEVYQLVPEFNKMSLKPGIGATWFDKYKDDVYPHDYVIVNGKKVKPPKYYDKRYSNFNGIEFEQVQFAREVSGRSRAFDNTDERLEVREAVVKASIRSLKRSLI